MGRCSRKMILRTWKQAWCRKKISRKYSNDWSKYRVQVWTSRNEKLSSTDVGIINWFLYSAQTCHQSQKMILQLYNRQFSSNKFVEITGFRTACTKQPLNEYITMLLNRRAYTVWQGHKKDRMMMDCRIHEICGHAECFTQVIIANKIDKALFFVM